MLATPDPGLDAPIASGKRRRPWRKGWRIFCLAAAALTLYVLTYTLLVRSIAPPHPDQAQTVEERQADSFQTMTFNVRTKGEGDDEWSAPRKVEHKLPKTITYCFLEEESRPKYVLRRSLEVIYWPLRTIDGWL